VGGGKESVVHLVLTIGYMNWNENLKNVFFSFIDTAEINEIGTERERVV